MYAKSRFCSLFDRMGLSQENPLFFTNFRLVGQFNLDFFLNKHKIGPNKDVILF